MAWRPSPEQGRAAIWGRAVAPLFQLGVGSPRLSTGDNQGSNEIYTPLWRDRAQAPGRRGGRPGFISAKMRDTILFIRIYLKLSLAITAHLSAVGLARPP